MASSSQSQPETPHTGAQPRNTVKRGRVQRTAKSPAIVESAHEMQRLALSLRQQGKRVGFVPTMGALHEGHLSLVRQARQHSDVVAVSIFVNPLQFGVNEDLSRYPRTFERDRALCQAEDVDVIFLPSVQDMYPAGFQTRISSGELAQPMEGKLRPGHFTGMLTVVAKLFQIVQPTSAVFGEKDYQQLRLVEQMTRDLLIPVEIVHGPIVREADGLAMSSRNRYLSAGMRRRASILYRALSKAKEVAARPGVSRSAIIRACESVLATEPKFEPQYIKLVNPDTLQPMRNDDRVGRLLIAGHLGQRPRVRLIDNIAIRIER